MITISCTQQRSTSPRVTSRDDDEEERRIVSMAFMAVEAPSGWLADAKGGQLSLSLSFVCTLSSCCLSLISYVRFLCYRQRLPKILRTTVQQTNYYPLIFLFNHVCPRAKLGAYRNTPGVAWRKLRWACAFRGVAVADSVEYC